MPGLDRLIENAWDLGTFRAGAADLEPQGAAYGLTGLLGDDGLPYRRGGSVYQSGSALGTAGLAWVWSGYLGGGQRTVFQSAEANARLAVLDSDNSTVLNLRTDVAYGNAGKPRRIVVLAGMALVISAATEIIAYGGSRKTVGQVYTTGTVEVAKGSRTVTGTGTAWLANVDPGMILWPNNVAPYVVQSIESDTSLTLMLPWTRESLTGANTYVAGTFATLNPGGQALPFPGTTIFAVVANRLVTVSGDRLDFSYVNDPSQWAGEHRFASASILAVATLRDVLLVFTTVGVYAISNMAYDLTDVSGNPQQRKELVNADMIAWSHEGIAAWAGSLIVPCVDGIYLMDALGAPVRISDRVADLYLGYVRAGHKTGVGEVFNSHYVLPILDVSNNWVDTLACRLQPTHSGTAYGWTQLDGAGAEVAGFVERPGNPQKLLGASRRAASRVLDASGYFNPSATVKADADGTAHRFQLTTRNIPTGGMVTNSVQYIELFYTLTDAATDDPVFTAEYNADNQGWVALSGTAPEGGPDSPYVWPCAVAAKHIRFRFSSTLASSMLKVEALSIFVRKSGLYV